jgi:hypothetical protein
MPSKALGLSFVISSRYPSDLRGATMNYLLYILMGLSVMWLLGSCFALMWLADNGQKKPPNSKE